MLVAAAICCCWGLAASAASAAPGGSIAGAVTAADTHDPLKGVEVCAWGFIEAEGEEEGEYFEECTETDAAGAYSVEGLSEGRYEVEFQPGRLPYLVTNVEERVTVGAGPVAGIDAELEPAATIAGTVSAGGGPVAEDLVCAWRLPSAESGACAETAEDGSYSIKLVTGGKFEVEFEAIDGFATQYFDLKRHAYESVPVAATPGAVHEGVDGSLEPGGYIRGTVLSSSGVPLPEILVCAIEATGLEPEACDETGVFGQYSVGPLAGGSYKIGFSVALGREFFGEELFSGENDGFETRFYDEQTSLAAAGAIGLAAPGVVAGIDARLFPSTPSTAVPPPAIVTIVKPARRTETPKPQRCRRGYRKMKVKGGRRCVKIHRKRRHR